MSSSLLLNRTLGLLGLVGLLVGCGDQEQLSYDACPIPLGDAPTRGKNDAWVTIVEFADYQCPFCRYAEDTIAAVDEKHPGIRWAFKHFPLTNSHIDAEAAASASDCAHEQGKFWEMHDVLMEGKTPALDDASLEADAEAIGLDMDAWSSCFMSEQSLYRVLVDYKEGEAYGVEGTPTFFINGYVLAGVYPVDDFLAVVAQAEREAKDSGISKADYYDNLVGRGCHD